MTTVARQDSPVGPIVIRRGRGLGTHSYEQGDCLQSEADQHGVSLSSYIHALFGLLYQKQSHRVLMIGCGGGTLATLLARIGAVVTVVDINPAAFEFASKYFAMPSDVRCVVGDGAAYLNSAPDIYDAVVLDAYKGSTIPPQFTTDSFLRLVKSRLSPAHGLFLANVYLHHAFDFAADRMAEGALSLWASVRILDAQLHTSRNSIVMAGDVADLISPSLLFYPEVDWPQVSQELSLLAFREHRLVGAHSASRLGNGLSQGK